VKFQSPLHPHFVEVRTFTFVLIGVVFITALAACFNTEESAGPSPEREGPWEMVVKYETARLQGDEATRSQLLTSEEVESLALDSQQGPKNNKKVPDDYRLTMFKVNDEVYYYHIEYKLPHLPDPVGQYFKALNTSEGWKLEDLSRSDFEYETQDLDPQVIKGVHDAP